MLALTCPLSERMPFKKFVEVGRVAVLGGAGPDQGKIAAIVNVIDQNRVLIEVRPITSRFNSLHSFLHTLSLLSPLPSPLTRHPGPHLGRAAPGLPHQAAPAHPHHREVPLQRCHQDC